MKKILMLLTMLVFATMILAGTTVKFTEDYTIGGGEYQKDDVVTLKATDATTAIAEEVATTVIDARVQSVKTITTDSTISIQNDVLLIDCTSAAIAITTPDATLTKSIPYTLIKVDSTTNAATVTANGATQTLDAQYDTVTIISDGTNFLIQTSNIAP